MQNQNGDPVKASPRVFHKTGRIRQKVRGELEEVSDFADGKFRNFPFLNHATFTIVLFRNSTSARQNYSIGGPSLQLY